MIHQQEYGKKAGYKKRDERIKQEQHTSTNNETILSLILLLPDDAMMKIFQFVGPKQYIFIAGACKRFQEVYLKTFYNETDTSMESVATSLSRCQLFHSDQFFHTMKVPYFWCESEQLADWAVRLGRLEVLQFLSKRNRFLVMNSRKLDYFAAREGHLPILQWIWEEKGKNKILTCPRSCAGVAARNGHFEIVKYIMSRDEQSFKWLCGYSVCSNAAWGGHLDILQWARANAGCEWNYETCNRAAEHGHLDVLQWAHSNGCEWIDHEICSLAAKNGHLEVLKWARSNDHGGGGSCGWNYNTCVNAAANGHLHVLQWAHANGCDWNAQEVYINAAANGHLDVLKWSFENGLFEWDERIQEYAKRYDQTEILQWVRENKYFEDQQQE